MEFYYSTIRTYLIYYDIFIYIQPQYLYKATTLSSKLKFQATQSCSNVQVRRNTNYKGLRSDCVFCDEKLHTSVMTHKEARKQESIFYVDANPLVYTNLYFNSSSLKKQIFIVFIRPWASDAWLKTQPFLADEKKQRNFTPILKILKFKITIRC